jgi:hypothetical protein
MDWLDRPPVRFAVCLLKIFLEPSDIDFWEFPALQLLLFSVKIILVLVFEESSSALNLFELVCAGLYLTYTLYFLTILVDRL